MEIPLYPVSSEALDRLLQFTQELPVISFKLSPSLRSVIDDAGPRKPDRIDRTPSWRQLYDHRGLRSATTSPETVAFGDKQYHAHCSINCRRLAIMSVRRYARSTSVPTLWAKLISMVWLACAVCSWAQSLNELRNPWMVVLPPWPRARMT